MDAFEFLCRCDECSFRDRCNERNAENYARFMEHCSPEVRDTILGLRDDLYIVSSHLDCYEQEFRLELDRQAETVSGLDDIRRSLTVHTLRGRSIPAVVEYPELPF